MTENFVWWLHKVEQGSVTLVCNLTNQFPIVCVRLILVSL